MGNAPISPNERFRIACYGASVRDPHLHNAAPVIDRLAIIAPQSSFHLLREINSASDDTSAWVRLAAGNATIAIYLTAVPEVIPEFPERLAPGDDFARTCNFDTRPPFEIGDTIRRSQLHGEGHRACWLPRVRPITG